MRVKIFSRLENWQPDVIILSGAPIVKESLFSIPKQCLNMHLGISPRYRGETHDFLASAFWGLGAHWCNHS